MNDDRDDPQLTAKGIIDGLIIGFAAWMVVLVTLLIIYSLTEQPRDKPVQTKEPRAHPTVNQR